MTSTMLPPPHERDTEPPDNPRESSLPPADLGPAGIALRLLALEQQVGDIHIETAGISKAIHDVRNAMASLSDSYERLVTSLEILRHDAMAQRADRARAFRSIDELERRTAALEEEIAS